MVEDFEDGGGRSDGQAMTETTPPPEPESPPDFALALSILRQSRGWKQDRLAAIAGVTNSALSEYERGKKTPELRSLQKLLAALGYPLAAIDRVEAFLRELRELGSLEARAREDGELALVPAAPAPAPTSTSTRVRRVAALVGQAAAAFTLLLFDLLQPAAPAYGEQGPRRED